LHLPHRPRTGERLLMKTAIIGSRGIRNLRLEQFLPEDVSEIISGGARGVDALAAEYADIHEIPLKVFLPDYRRWTALPPARPIPLDMPANGERRSTCFA